MRRLLRKSMLVATWAIPMRMEHTRSRRPSSTNNDTKRPFFNSASSSSNYRGITTEAKKNASSSSTTATAAAAAAAAPSASNPTPVNGSTHEDVGGSGSKGEAAAEFGWRYETVDENYQTELEAAYERNREKIQRLFSEPLIMNLPRHDGNFHPDLFIGLSHYDHRNRDEYRQVVARALGVSPLAVALSSAWSGRFNPSVFPHSRKVLGVSIKKVAAGGDGDDRDSATAAGGATSIPEKRLRAAVEQFNSGAFSQHHINAASVATAEVDIKPENPNVYRLAKYIASDAQAHQVYALCFTETNKELLLEVLGKWLNMAEVVPKIVLATQILEALSMPTALHHPGTEEYTESFNCLVASLKKVAGGYDVEPSTAVFINGSLVGSLRDMSEFLRRNSGGLIAALQRPDHIALKSAVMKRAAKVPRPVLMRDSSVASAK